MTITYTLRVTAEMKDKIVQAQTGAALHIGYGMVAPDFFYDSQKALRNVLGDDLFTELSALYKTGADIDLKEDSLSPMAVEALIQSVEEDPSVVHRVNLGPG